MKKLFISLLLVVTTVMSANAMSKYRASREARFLTDKMAWELDLTPMQIEDVYEINYDYFRSLVSVHTNYSREYDIRNEELRFVLSPWQWERFIAREYFLTPVRIVSFAWHFAIYNYYRHDHFYYDAPHAYSHYRGGHALNRDYYSGRRDFHHPGGNFRPAPAPKPAPKPMPKAGAGPQNRPGNSAGINNGKPNNGGNASKQNGNMGKPNNNGNMNHGNGNRPNNNAGAAPSRTTPNRSGAANRSNGNTRSNNAGQSTRPTRSQQNAGSHSTTSGRR